MLHVEANVIWQRRVQQSCLNRWQISNHKSTSHVQIIKTSGQLS